MTQDNNLLQAGGRGAPPVLALVLPCHNEEEALPATLQTIADKLRQWKAEGVVAAASFACFVDDGSQDATWRILQSEGVAHWRIRLASNAGQQNATLAGLRAVAERCDCCITVDADLQDDINVIPQMVARFGEGAEVVYGVRNDRASDSFFKRNTAALFYAAQSLMGINAVPQHSEFRLMSRRCLRMLAQYNESHLYMRGIVPSFKLPSARVAYKRLPRMAGQTKYGFFKMVALAVNAILSFSVVPLRFITFLGLAISFCSFAYMAVTIYGYFKHGEAFASGWASLIVSLYFLGGLILLSLGVIGEYIGKIFQESKKRPLYAVDEDLPPQA